MRFIDPDGRNPAILVVGGAVLTVADLALISAGVITTGVIIRKTADGSFGLNQGVKDLVSRFSPGYKEQQKRESTQKESLDKSQANVQKSIENNVGKPSPEGTPDPKGDLSTIGKVVVGTGLGAEAVKGTLENTGTTNTQQSNGPTNETKSDEPSSQPVIQNADTKDSNTETKIPISTWKPLPKDEDKPIQIPLR